MLHESIKWMCPVQNFLPSKQHAQKFLSCQLFAYKEPVNCSAQLFGFAQKILGTKHCLNCGVNSILAFLCAMQNVTQVATIRHDLFLLTF
jgi:hypothetical protein